MSRLTLAGCLMAVCLFVPSLNAQEKPADNPAARKLDRDIPRHKEFLKRIEQTQGVGDVVFLGDSITNGWEGQKTWQEYFGEFKPVSCREEYLAYVSALDRYAEVICNVTDGASD